MKIKLANRLGLSLAPYPTPLKMGLGRCVTTQLALRPGHRALIFTQDRNFYRIMTGSELLQQRGRWEAARAIYSGAMQVASSRPDRHLDLYRFALHFCRLAIALTIFLGAFLMQISTTTRGEFVRSPRRADRVDGSRNRRSPWILPQATPRSSRPPPNVGQIYR